MDNDTKKLIAFVDAMEESESSLFQALTLLDSLPAGRRLRLIKNVNQHILERKLNVKRKGIKSRVVPSTDQGRPTYEGNVNKGSKKSFLQDRKEERETRAKQQKEDSGA